MEWMKGPEYIQTGHIYCDISLNMIILKSITYNLYDSYLYSFNNWFVFVVLGSWKCSSDIFYSSLYLRFQHLQIE